MHHLDGALSVIGLGLVPSVRITSTLEPTALGSHSDNPTMQCLPVPVVLILLVLAEGRYLVFGIISGRYYFSFSISYFCLMDWASLLRCICGYFLLNWVTRILNVPLFVCSCCWAKSSDQHMRLLFTFQPSQGDALIAKLFFGP